MDERCDMKRIARGWRLACASLVEVRRDPILLVFPLISSIALIVVCGLYLAALRNNDNINWIVYVPLYFVTTFIGIFSNASVMAAAVMRFNGEQPTISGAMNLTMSKLPSLLAWTAVSTTVGLAIRTAEERLPIVGRIMFSIIGMAWGVVTFLVVPVLLFEDLGVKDGVKRSVSLVRARWGEQLVGNASISALTILFIFPIVFISFAIMSYSVISGIAFGVITFAMVVLISQAMQSVFNAALYLYAIGEESVGAFTDDDLGAAFGQRRGLMR